MTAPSTDIRVRRPQQHERLLVELQREAAFVTIRDVLLYAASVGVYFKRRQPFSATAGDPIRYETLTSPAYADTLINMIAASEVSDDPEIMDQSRIGERVQILEEYANGGLDYIQEQVNVRHQPANLVVLALMTEALSRSGGAEPASVEELLRGVSWA